MNAHTDGKDANVNGLVIDGANTGRPTLRALYDDEHPEGREATVAELAFWREVVRLRGLLWDVADPDYWPGSPPAFLSEFREPSR